MMGDRYFGDLLNDIARYQEQLADRDAEIANLEKWRDALMKQTAEQVAEIAALKAQVAELEAWKAAVPVKELNHMLTTQVPFDSVEADIVWKWLKPTR